MICQKCGKHPATVHYTNIINGMKTEYYFCDACASGANLGQMDIQDLISGFFGMKTRQELETLTCDFCHSSLADVKKRGKAGCEHCYSVFASYLDPIVRKVHGNDTHVGKQPAAEPKAVQVPKPQVTPDAETKPEPGRDADKYLEQLQAQMRQAVAEENYEEAARLRDAIREYEKKEDTP